MSKASIRAALGLLLAFGAEVRAERSLTSVAVAVDPRRDAKALEAWRALQEGLSEAPGYVDLTRKALPDLVGREARAKRARALLVAANEAFESLEVETADARVDEALSLLESSDLTRSFPDLLEGLAMKALILHARGDSGATGVVGRLLALAPDYRFASPRFNPKFTRLAESQRRKVNAASRTSLEVIAEGTSAWVFVDGSYRGVSPLQVKGLAPGTHYVTLVAPGYALVQGTAVAGSGKPFEEKLTPSVPGTELLSRLGDFTAGLRQRAIVEPARALGAWAKADEVLAAVVEQDGRVTLARVAGTDLPPLTDEVPAGADDAALVQAARELLARKLPEPVEPPHPETSWKSFPATATATPAPPATSTPTATPAPAPVPKVAKAPQAKPAPASGNGKALGFALLGSGVTAGVSGVLLALEAQRQTEAAKAIPPTQIDRYTQAERSARVTGLVAGSLFGIAAVSAGAGVLVLLSQGGEPPKSNAPAKGPPPRVSLGLAPLRDGGVFTVSGDF